MGKGTQSFVADPRNERVLVYVDGALVPRDEAKVSVFDSGFVLGDGVWEGFRLVNGRIAFLDAHLDRLYEGARANDLRDGVHVRLMVTRGLRKTPNQDPRIALGTPTIVIVAEWKEPDPELFRRGLRLFTSTIRCSPPDMFDMRLNSHSRLNL